MDSRCISSMNNDKIFKNKVQNPLRNSQIMKNNGMNSSFSSKFWQSQIQNIGGGNYLNYISIIDFTSYSKEPMQGFMLDKNYSGLVYC